MFVAQIKFESRKGKTTDEQQDEVDIFLGSLRMDGRILGRELLTIRDNSEFKAFVPIPAKDAFKNLNDNQYVRKRIKNLKELGISKPTLHILGEETSEALACECGDSSGYILFTHYVMIQSPLKCFDCFSPVPLYRIPRFAEGDYHPLISWQTDYKACDSLQMNCQTGERFGLKEMSQLDSSLTKRGLEICSQIKELTKKDCYYYLHKYYGKRDKKERERKCPSCNGEWLLDEQWHKFDFRCDKCHLLSNIASSL